MTAIIKKSKAEGTVRAPSSKSMAHRLLICAALAKGESEIKNVTYSEDILATLACLRKMGAEIKTDGDTVHVRGIENIFDVPESDFFCRESGSTLRFILPLLLLNGNKQRFTGAGLLMKRPMSVYEEICKNRGLYYSQTPDAIEIKGKITGGDFTVPGNISSQFISGLLFTLPFLKEESRIKLIPLVESRSYIKMTVDAMESFGVNIRWEDENTLYAFSGSGYKPCSLSVEGDYSGAAFLDAFNVLGGSVTVSGLKENSLQGDSVYKKLYPLIENGKPEIDVSDCPDLAPILMTLAAAKNGAVFTGTKRLRLKESDRGAVMKQELSKFGAKITIEENRITVEPSLLHKPSETLSGHNDHRVVMSLAVLGSVYGAEIDGSEAVNKSFPGFFEAIKGLKIEVENK
ncbi:MAG: 3-phosphoshikimate 1-carboxyvinyltransferase [Acutalibacteraceae bacterium]